MKQLVIKGFVFLICVFLTISAVIGCILYNHKQNNKLENLKYNQTELLSSTISKNSKSKMDFTCQMAVRLAPMVLKGFILIWQPERKRLYSLHIRVMMLHMSGYPIKR